MPSQLATPLCCKGYLLPGTLPEAPSCLPLQNRGRYIARSWAGAARWKLQVDETADSLHPFPFRGIINHHHHITTVIIVTVTVTQAKVAEGCKIASHRHVWRNPLPPCPSRTSYHRSNRAPVSDTATPAHRSAQGLPFVEACLLAMGREGVVIRRRFWLAVGMLINLDCDTVSDADPPGE